MRKLKTITIYIFVLFFTLGSYGSTMKPTADKVFLKAFLTDLYSFDNDKLQNLNFYNFMYPWDKFTVKLRDYMTEKTFQDFGDKKLYYDYVTTSYYNGFHSSVYYIKIKSSNKNISSITYTYEATVELFYRHKSKREIYTVNGEVDLSNINGKYKITKITKLVFPTAGFSNVISKLV